jgi:hypothetical protein
MNEGAHFVQVNVNPGVCGFECVIKAWQHEVRMVKVVISESKCRHIQRMSEHLRQMTLNELFAPVPRNPAFVSATEAGCHTSCPVPVAVLKAAEVAMGMALPKDVHIHFL